MWKTLDFLMWTTFSMIFVMVDSEPLYDDLSSTRAFPIDLYDLGFDGTWEKFCNEEEIEKLYPKFPEYDLRRLRNKICFLKLQYSRNTKIEDDDLIAIGAYKYCFVMKFTFDEFLIQFIDKLSLSDPEKESFLLDRYNQVNQTTCYNTTVDAFYKTCVGQNNPCIKMFKLILARACGASWLTIQNILSYIDEICAGKWVTDNIEWSAIFRSIKYES